MKKIQLLISKHTLNIYFFQEGFPEFEKELQSVTKLKCESLSSQADPITSEILKIVLKFKEILQSRKREKLKRLEDQEKSLEKNKKDLCKEIESIRSKDLNIDDIFTTEEVEKLLDKFESEVFENKLPEETVYEKFLKKVNDNVKKNFGSKEKTLECVFNRWKKTLEDKHEIYISETQKSLTQKSPDVEKKPLSANHYNKIIDPNTYYTNNFLCVAAVGGVVLGATILIPGIAGM